jgi:hypothetical protein
MWWEEMAKFGVQIPYGHFGTFGYFGKFKIGIFV